MAKTCELRVRHQHRASTPLCISGSADATFDAAQDTVAVGFLGDAGLDFGNLAEAVSNLVAAEDVLQQQNDSDRAVAEPVSRSVQGGDSSSGLDSLGLLAEDYGSESDPDSQSALRDAQTSIAAAHPIAATNRYAIFNDDDEDAPDDELHADQIAAETATTAGATAGGSTRREVPGGRVGGSKRRRQGDDATDVTPHLPPQRLSLVAPTTAEDAVAAISASPPQARGRGRPRGRGGRGRGGGLPPLAPPQGDTARSRSASDDAPGRSSPMSALGASSDGGESGGNDGAPQYSRRRRSPSGGSGSDSENSREFGRARTSSPPSAEQTAQRSASAAAVWARRKKQPSGATGAPAPAPVPLQPAPPAPSAPPPSPPPTNAATVATSPQSCRLVPRPKMTSRARRPRPMRM